jgi:anti-anti-sigma regulatory factor
VALHIAEVAASGSAIKIRLVKVAHEMATPRNDDFRVELCGDLSLPSIAQAHEKVLEAFEQDLPIVVDLDGVTGADLTLIQLLEAARLSASRRGRSLALSAPASGATRAVLERGGFLGAPDRAAFWLNDTVIS